MTTSSWQQLVLSHSKKTTLHTTLDFISSQQHYLSFVVWRCCRCSHWHVIMKSVSREKVAFSPLAIGISNIVYIWVGSQQRWNNAWQAVVQREKGAIFIVIDIASISLSKSLHFFPVHWFHAAGENSGEKGSAFSSCLFLPAGAASQLNIKPFYWADSLLSLETINLHGIS